MSESTDLNRVKSAIKAVMNECLKHNSDDTLSEKLYSYLKFELKVDFNDKKSIVELIETSFSQYSEHQLRSDLIPKLRICGSLLSDEHVFDPQLKSLEFIKLLSNNIIITNNSSLKFSYFKCLNDIAYHSSGCDWILSSDLKDSVETKTFLQLLLKFLTQTESRYVERQVRLLFITLLKHSFIDSSKIYFVKQFKQVFDKVMSPLNSLSLEIINECLLSLGSKHEFLVEYDITTTLVSNIEVWIERFGEKVYQLCETLGLCIDNNENVLLIFDKLLQSNHLKALIGFLTSLTNFDSNYFDKWFGYTLGSFAVKNNELIIDLNLSQNDTLMLKNFSDKSINDYSLKQLKKINLKYLDSKKTKLSFEILLSFTKLNYLNRSMRKTIIQTLTVIEKICFDSSLNNDLIFEQSFIIYAQLLMVFPNDLKLIVLKSLRLLIGSKQLPQSINYNSYPINQVLIELNNTLNNNNDNTLDEYNWEIVDSVMEVFYCVCQSNNVMLLKSVCPQLIQSVFFIWTTNREDLCSTLRASLVSNLIIIYLTLSNDDLMNLGIKIDDDLKSLLHLLYNDEIIVRNSIIKTLSDNISLLFKIETQNTNMFINIMKTMCRVSILDLDDDLQCNSLDFLHKLFSIMIDNNDNQFSHLINLFFNSGFFHILHYIVNSNSILFKVKIKSVKIIDYLRVKFKALHGNIIIQTIEAIIPKSLTLTSLSSDSSSNGLGLNEIDSIDSNTVFNFILNYDTISFVQNGSEDSPNLCILDDILSVSIVDSDILIDCY